MTVTLNLPLQVEQAYLAEARARGLSIEDLVRDVLLASQPSHAVASSPDERVRQFEVWAQSHVGNTIVLPDAAMERESIYGNHGV